MYFRIAIEVILSVFAVLGLYGTVRLIMQKTLGDKRIFIAVELLADEDAECAERLIRDALEAFLLLPSDRVAVIVASELANDERILEAARKYGVECYIIEKE